MRHRRPLVPVLNQDSVWGIAKRKGLFEKSQIVGGFRFEAGIGKERSCPLRHIRRDADNGNIIFPMILRHVLGSRLAMAALRIVKEEEDAPFLERERLAIGSDNIGSLGAAKSRSRKAKTSCRAHGNNSQNNPSVTNPRGRPHPPSGNERGKQHSSITSKKAGSDGSLNPRKTTAFLAQQRRIIDPDINHENHQQQRSKRCTPAAELWNQN